MSATAALALALTLAAPAQVPESAHKGYAEVLKTHVKKGRVDYKTLSRDTSKLDQYLAAVAKANLPKGKQARMAFYIDAYNALVIKSVITHGRPRSVLDVKGFFKEAVHTVAGKQVSLDALEKKHLNPFAKDPRTHFVLVCAAVGCPIIEARPFVGGGLERRLDAATRRYLSGPTGAKVSDGAIALSKIFDWYKADFGGSQGVLSFVKRHLPKAQQEQLGATPKVGYVDYNWTLNQQ